MLHPVDWVALIPAESFFGGARRAEHPGTARMRLGLIPEILPVPARLAAVSMGSRVGDGQRHVHVCIRCSAWRSSNSPTAKQV